eukprot:13214089-Ditylum_brightwellii.AAC.1
MQTGIIKPHAMDAAAKRKKGSHEWQLVMRKETQLELIKLCWQRAQLAPSWQSCLDIGPGQTCEDILKQTKDMEQK